MKFAARITALTLVFCVCWISAPAHAATTHSWPAGGDAEDVIGSADGVLSGGTSFGSGYIAQGFMFDGIDDSVAFGTEAGNFGASDFTIAFAIRTTNSTRLEGIFGKRATCTASSFWDVRSGAGGTLSLELYGTTENTGVSTLVPVNDGRFHVVVFTRAGSLVSSYVDGVLSATNDVGFVATVSNDAQLVAATSACTGLDGTNFFTGTLDELRLADSADSFLLAPPPRCGDATNNIDITAADALFGLRAAVGLHLCEMCICDVNDSGTISASDALAILRVAVGQPVTLSCPACE